MVVAVTPADGQRVDSLGRRIEGRSPGRPSRRELERAARLAEVTRQVEAGELVVRELGPEDLARLEAARRRRDRAAGAQAKVAR